MRRWFKKNIMLIIITSFVSACLVPSKPPSSGETMSSLCNCHMEHSSKSFGTLCFTTDSVSMISKVSQTIGDSRTFGFFIIHSTNFSLNASLICFVQKMHGLTDHFTSVVWAWAIKCLTLVEAYFCDDTHLKYYIELNT